MNYLATARWFNPGGVPLDSHDICKYIYYMEILFGT